MVPWPVSAVYVIATYEKHVLSIFKCIFGKVSESAVFSVTGIESGKLLLNFAQSQSFRSNSVSRPLKFGKF